VSSGLVIVGIGLAILTRGGVHANYAIIAGSLVVTAVGMGLTTAPSTGAIMVSLPLDKAGVGSAVNDTTRELGGALGVAVFGSLLASRYHATIGSHLASVPATARSAVHQASASLGAALQSAGPLPRPAAAAVDAAARTTYVSALHTTLLVIVIVALLASAFISWLLRPAATRRAAEARRGEEAARAEQPRPQTVEAA
jgi:hypothetical protein